MMCNLFLSNTQLFSPEVVMTVTTGSFLIEKGEEREIEKYIVHRNYDEETTENDIALIKVQLQYVKEKLFFIAKTVFQQSI